jgi:hypothetical protein
MIWLSSLLYASPRLRQLPSTNTEILWYTSALRIYPDSLSIYPVMRQWCVVGRGLDMCGVEITTWELGANSSCAA